MTKTATINGKLGDVNDVRYTLKNNIEVIFDVDGSGYSEARCERLGISGVDMTDAKALDDLRGKIIASYEQLRMKEMYKPLSGKDLRRFENLSYLVDRKAYDPRSELELSPK
jgi:hypothetical protein